MSEVEPVKTMAAETAESDQLRPPPELQKWVGEGFEGPGAEFFGYFKDLCNLKPDEAVLDVGCGSGRLALPLTRFLSGAARYEGFDVSRPAIDWCASNITATFPNFRFQVADVRNEAYGVRGRLRPSEYSFPYGDEMFDFVFLTSVFTHMLPNDMRHYVAEVARVLKPAGRCLITYFLLNSQSTELMPDKARFGLNFKYPIDNGCILNSDVPEVGVAYHEKFVRAIYQSHGLRLMEPIHYGSWCGREKFLSMQDIVIATKFDRDSRGDRAE